ncbi:Cytochrome P450 superfamily protein [Abortiporus biennis]
MAYRIFGINFGTIFDSLPWLAYFARNVPGLGEDVKRMREMGIGKAALRNKQGSKTKDLFYYLSNDDLPEEKKANPAIVIAEGILATVAGSDTTSNALTVALYFLLKNQDAYRRLQAEVDKFYPQGEDPLDSKHYKDMEFLEAVINETLRMYPAVMSGSQRSVMRGQGGKLIGQYYIPEDTQVRIPTYTLHRDPRNFSPYPDTFWPDRWLIAEGRQESKEEIVHQVNAFIPFSFGPANCVGKNLAWTQLRMVLVALLHKFEIKPVKGWDADEWERLITEQYITMRTSLPVILERR